MVFYFANKTGDALMAKIHLRDIIARAKQWDHPVKGLFKYVESMKQNGKDIFRLPRKDRERYCVSILSLALKNDTNEDWWMNMPNEDPPDGLVMTFKEEQPGAYMGYLREVEVVEHRDKPEKLFDTIRNKMVGHAYASNTILVCLILSSTVSQYDFRELATKMSSIESSIKHVFVIFTGAMMTDSFPTKEKVQSSYTMVQMLPVFNHGTVDPRPHIKDFEDRFKNGQESRIIEGNEVYYGTTNKDVLKK